jgi:hypothetical protein
MELSFAVETISGSIIFIFFDSGSNPSRFQVEEGTKNGKMCARLFYPLGGPSNLFFILF